MSAHCQAQALATDSRQTFTHDSPTWLRAIGRLEVPGTKYERGLPRNHWENCSATLVSRSSARSANTIITAWHCLEFYRDLSKTITFTLLHGTEQSFSIAATRLADGGGMHADWAVLRLLDPVPADQVAGLSVHPGRADRARTITMAGYSRDDHANPRGQRLSYDSACAITGQSHIPGNSESNCTALKGASGGAVVQLSQQGEPLLAGVISQGNGSDLSIFVPVADFRTAIMANLR